MSKQKGPYLIRIFGEMLIWMLVTFSQFSIVIYLSYINLFAQQQV